MNFHKLILLPHQRGMAFDGKGLLQKAFGDLRKALTCNAFSISAGKWTGEARAKIIEKFRLARVPAGWNHAAEKDKHLINMLEHVPIAKPLHTPVRARGRLLTGHALSPPQR